MYGISHVTVYALSPSPGDAVFFLGGSCLGFFGLKRIVNCKMTSLLAYPTASLLEVNVGLKEVILGPGGQAPFFLFSPEEVDGVGILTANFFPENVGLETELHMINRHYAVTDFAVTWNKPFIFSLTKSRCFSFKETTYLEVKYLF